jgi:hypothetical protein
VIFSPPSRLEFGLVDHGVAQAVEPDVERPLRHGDALLAGAGQEIEREGIEP